MSTARGGRRDGAGRPTVVDEPIARNIRLSRRQAERIAVWAMLNGLSESEATRQLIDLGLSVEAR